jgi:multidrug resistance efflux pump
MSYEQANSQSKVAEQQLKPENIIKISYKRLYKNQKKNIQELEAELEDKNNELDILKILLKSKEREIEDIKVKSLSYTNSQTAKNGYKEELVCKDLNSEPNAIQS